MVKKSTKIRQKADLEKKEKKVGLNKEKTKKPNLFMKSMIKTFAITMLSFFGILILVVLIAVLRG